MVVPPTENGKYTLLPRHVREKYLRDTIETIVGSNTEHIAAIGRRAERHAAM